MKCLDFATYHKYNEEEAPFQEEVLNELKRSKLVCKQELYTLPFHWLKSTPQKTIPQLFNLILGLR